MDEKLIDEIYEAAFIPEKWEELLQSMADIADCRRALMFATNGTEARGGFSTPATRQLAEEFIGEGWMARNSLGQRGLNWGVPAFVTDFDLFTPEELETDSFYQEFLRPREASWCTGAVLKSPSDDTIIISLHRAYEEGPVERSRVDRLTALRPHLGRATLAAARLGLEQAKSTVTALAAVGLPAAALSRAGQLRAANALFEPLLPALVADHADRLRFVHRGADVLFADALRRGNAGLRAGLSFPVPAREPHVPLVMHLVPIRRAAQDIFSSVSWLLVAIPVSQSGTLDTRLLEGLFDLTPAEARVARGILFGKTMAQIAADHAVSPETTRSQLKAVLAKTGTARQSELASLLGGLKKAVLPAP